MIEALPDPETDAKATHLVSVATEAREQALALVVRTPHEYEQVSEFRKSVKARYNEIEGYRTHLKEPFLEGGRRIDEFFRKPLQALKEAETSCKDRLLGYDNEQRRLAAEEQRRLDEKARKEREALEAKARAEREKADQAAAELRRQAEAASAAERVRLEAEARRVEERSEAKAQTMETKAAQVVAPEVHASIPLVAGQYIKTVWKARVVDKKAVPDEYKVVDQGMLDKMAQATKGAVPVPGVEWYEERVMVGKAK